MLKKIHIPLLIILSTLFLLFSYIPNLYEASVTDIMPQDRIMVWGEHIYTYDYNVYLSKMRQGAEGRWAVVDKYDNNPKRQGVMLQMLYLLFGKIGSLLQLSQPLTFHLLRTVLSFTWVLTIIYLNIFFLKKPKYYIPGVLLSLLAASFPVFYQYQNQTWVGMHMSWWTEMDVLKRISYIPHYTLNYIITGVLSVLLYKFSTRPNLQFSIFKLISIILFLSFFIHPAAGILFFFSWFLYYLIELFWQPSRTFKRFPSYLVYSLILAGITLIPLLYIRHVTSDYPWKSLVDFDKNYRIGVNIKEYILALGPVFFTGVLGLILVFLKKEKRLLPLVTWILGAFIGIYVFKRFPYQSELRFVQTANHIPLAILSVYFFSWFWKRFSYFFIRFIIIIIAIAIILLGVVQSYFSIKAQTDFIHQRAVATQPLVPYPSQVMYPLKDFWNAIIWLQKNTKNEDVVLSQVNAGNYIPAYAGNFVYIGHNPETPFYNERFAKVEQFFLGTMSGQDALNFLKNEKIAYIFYGPQEKEKSVEDIKKYQFIKQVFKSSYVTIYVLTAAH